MSLSSGCQPDPDSTKCLTSTRLWVVTGKFATALDPDERYVLLVSHSMLLALKEEVCLVEKVAPNMLEGVADTTTSSLVGRPCSMCCSSAAWMPALPDTKGT